VPRHGNWYQALRGAAQVYWDADKVDDGRAFVQRAFEIMEAKEDWRLNGALIRARFAREWQLPAAEDRDVQTKKSDWSGSSANHSVV
jgi:hypothetical protein